ncbi:hypothetical protein BG003_000265 [Podila horticola]|nr:hypothetical protein BG003_000265 [Podila horticola]
MSLAAQTSVQSFQDLRCGYYQAIMRGQVQQVEGIKTEIIKHFQEVKTEPDKLNADLEKNAELQDKLVKMGETMLKMQELSLNRLTSSQTQIQAVPTLTYELQAYLSRGYSSSSPELNDGETESYCLSLSNMSGTYDQAWSTGIDRVHLADHPGYDISEPKTWFKKFGPNILTIMRLIQLGTRIAGMVVPNLVSSDIATAVKEVETELASLIQDSPNF